MTHDESDFILTLVAGLRAPRPSLTCEDRIRRRCHDVMDRKARRRHTTPLLPRAVDLALIGVVACYAVIAVVQATEVAAQVLGLR